MLYPSKEFQNSITTVEQQEFNREHFPSTLFSGSEMSCSIEVAVVNSDKSGKLLHRDILKVAPKCEMDILEHDGLFSGNLFAFYPENMDEAESIVQFFRNSTYWQVEYVNIESEWQYE